MFIQPGFWIMASAVIVISAIFGFRLALSKSLKAFAFRSDDLIVTFFSELDNLTEGIVDAIRLPIWIYVFILFGYYVGALMLQPTMIDATHSSFDYAVTTVFFGFVTTVAVTVLSYFFFKLLNWFSGWYTEILTKHQRP